MPFKPSDELVMRFTVTEWNEIVAQLREGAYKTVAPLINKITVQAAQLEQEAAKAQTQAVETTTGYTNGELPPQPDLIGDIRAEVVGAKSE